jgi:hypothetical protein
MKKICLLLLLTFLLGAFTGCAFNIVQIRQVPVQYKNVNAIKPDFILKDEVKIELGTGYSRKLNEGTKWHYFNTIPYGDIFKTKDQILTIEGSNIFEAFIVVSGENLVGFFLPVEQTYSPLKKPKPLTIVKIDQ